MTEPTISFAWLNVNSPSELKAASYLSGPNAKQYRFIVDTLAEQQEFSLTGIGFDELATLLKQRLPQPPEELFTELNLQSRLNQLVEWGTCESWQDKATTEEEFLRNRHRYQLSEAGAAINRAAIAIEKDLGPTSTAVLLAPKVLAERLTAALEGFSTSDTDQASTEFAQVETTLEAMSQAASEWQSRLAAALGGVPTHERISRLLETVLAYVDAWGAGIDAWSGQIAQLLPALRAVPDVQWRALTLARLGADVPPATIDAATARTGLVVTALERWFDGDAPQAQRLRGQMRDAVVPVLRGHRTLLAVGGTVSRSSELLRLAEAIDSADTETEAWRLWQTGTGLFSAQHFTQTSPEIQSPLPVWEAPPVPVSRRLRMQGSRSLTGRAPRLPDTAAARARARQSAMRAQADAAEAGRRLAARSGTPFSQWEALTDGETELLLGLISACRDNRDEGVSSDGRWTMRLTPVTPPSSAVLHTPSGRLVLADAVVEITA